jgi:hypothetical protein
MPQITNLNVQVNQNLEQHQVGQGQAGEARRLDGASLPGIRSGALVEGQVLSQNPDGSYMVRVSAQGGKQAQNLLARATVELIVGERFTAVWDTSGEDKIPVLRLSEGELSFLSKLPAADRELATALLARGMPLSDEVMHSVREAWRRMGGKPDQLASLLELWARGLPMTPDNAQTLSWYMGLNGEAVTSIWERIRRTLKERARNGEDPVDILRGLKDGGDQGNESNQKDVEVAKFLRGHSLLLRAPRGDVDPALLSAPMWPADGDAPHVMARVFLGRVHEHGGRRYWQMGFGVEGSRLGFIGGDVESDGRSYNLNLYAEHPATCETLKRKRHAIRKELEGVPLELQFIGISRLVSASERRKLLSGRGLDITV